MVNVEKYSGTGNDFFIVDASTSVPDRRAFAAEVCEEGLDHPGAERSGADGVLFLALENGFEPPRIVMTLVQPDGSIVPMCGNAAACGAAWAANRTDATEVMIDTQSGTRRAVVDGERVSVEMGTPTFAPGAIPVESDQPVVEAPVAGLRVTAVSADIPHGVAFVDDPDAVDLAAVAAELDRSETFPEGTNVTVAAETGDGRFSVRTYKRGLDAEIESCGTGAVAAAATARRLGLFEGPSAAVDYPGGELAVRRTDAGVELESTIERVFAGAVATTTPAPSPALD